MFKIDGAYRKLISILNRIVSAWSQTGRIWLFLGLMLTRHTSHCRGVSISESIQRKNLKTMFHFENVESACSYNHVRTVRSLYLSFHVRLSQKYPTQYRTLTNHDLNFEQKLDFTTSRIVRENCGLLCPFNFSTLNIDVFFVSACQTDARRGSEELANCPFWFFRDSTLSNAESGKLEVQD